MKVFILAGGFATRLWPLTENRAKPLLLLDGKPIFHHILEKIPENFPIILLTNQKFKSAFEKSLRKFEKISGKKLDIEIFLEDAFSDGDKLGALGAISAAINHYEINDDILILAGDNLLPELDLTELQCKKDSAVLSVREVSDFYEARKFGVIELEAGAQNLVPYKDTKKRTVISFQEKPEKPRSKMVSTGFCSIGKELLPVLQDFAKREPDALGGIFQELLSQGKKVEAVTVKGDWFDVGSFETYLAAHRQITYKYNLPDNFEQGNNKFSGKIFIGEGCVVENCILRDVIIYPNTTLINCHMSNTIIDEDCYLENIDLSQKLIRHRTKLVG